MFFPSPNSIPNRDQRNYLLRKGSFLSYFSGFHQKDNDVINESSFVSRQKQCVIN